MVIEQSRETALRAQTRQASVVMLIAVVLWMAGSWVGGVLGLPVRWAFLLDLACLAALAWSVIVLLKVWRARQELEN